MNEILKRNGLPTEGAAHITINLIKLIAEQYAKEKVRNTEIEKNNEIFSRNKRIKELEEEVKQLKDEPRFG